MFCTNCGARLDAGVRFCTACGAPIEVDGSRTPEAPAAGHAPDSRPQSSNAPEPAVEPAPEPTTPEPSGDLTEPVADVHTDQVAPEASTPTEALPSLQTLESEIADMPTAAFPTLPEVPDLHVPDIAPETPSTSDTPTLTATKPLPLSEQAPAPEPAPTQGPTPAPAPAAAATPAAAPEPVPQPIAAPEPEPAPQPRMPIVGSASAPSFTPVGSRATAGPATQPSPMQSLQAVADVVTPPATQSSAAPATPHATARRKSHRGLIALICTLVVLATGCATAYFTLRATMFSPAGPIREYVNAISSGDFARANELANPGIDNAQRALLVPDVAKDQANRIHDVSVSEATKGAGNAYTATVSYTVNGARQSMTVSAEPAGKQWLVFDTWKITPMLQHVTVALPQSMHNITVNGVSLDLSTLGNGDPVAKDPTDAPNYDSSVNYQDMRQYQLSVYPGMYQFGIAPSSYVSAQPVTVTKADGAAYLLPKGTDKLRNALLDAVNKNVQTCIASTAIKPPSDCEYALDMSDTTATLGPSMTRTLKTKIALDDVDLNSGTFSTGQFEIEGAYQYQWAGETTWTDGKAWTYVTLTGTFSLNNEQLDVNVHTTTN